MSATCAGPDCRRPARACGLCWGHYQQQRRGGEFVELRLPHGRVSPDESFRCETYAAFLTFRACIARHAAKKATRSRWGRHLRAKFPECATCAQGRKLARRYPDLAADRTRRAA